MGTATQDSEPVPRVVRPRRAAAQEASKKSRRGKSRRKASRKAGAPEVERGKGAKKAEREKAKGDKAKGDKAKGDKAKGDKAGDSARRSTARTGRGRIASLFVAPELRGPRVRVGILWFLLAMAAATAGRWWTAGLWALLAAIGGREMVAVWSHGSIGDSGDGARERTVPRGFELLAATGAAAVPLAAAYGTGTAGLVLIGVALGSVAVALLAGGRRSRATCLPLAAVLPAVPATAVVLAVRVDLWVGLFLVLAVSLYDAGAFVMGADAAGPWEGPVSGAVGTIAATFTMAAFGVPPFDAASVWITGALVAVCCPLGTALVSAALPAPEDHVRALRRLDTYLVSAPLVVGAAWLVS